MLSLTALATQYQMQQNDMQQAATISAEVQAQAQRSQAQRWQLQEDTQTKIFSIQQDTTVNRARTQDKMYEHWDSLIRG